ncbi:MAG TPA: carboxypeptidase regulatory-like domain-containing protein, partial [Streptosporangiaceae bacterium]|nr:carboxypeptidase regulatory-like domain-containing protein [Streptosporangiaceae bacterium]
MGRVPVRLRAAVRLTGILAGVLIFGFLFATSMMWAFRAPSPHDIPVAVVGPSPVVTQIQAALGQQAPGVLQPIPYPSVSLARQAIMDRHVDAAFALPAADPGGGKPRAQVIVASAISPLMADMISTAFTHVAAAMGAGVAVQDIAPLPAGDPSGVSPFYFAIVLLLPSFIGGVLITFATKRTAIALKMAGAVTFAACLAAADVAVADGLLGALTGHAAELFGVGVLTSLAFIASVVALGRVLGAPGIGLAALTFFVAGLPTSGGPSGLPFLPAVYRFVGDGLPPANAVTAAQNVSYFGGHAISVPLGVLAAWAGGGLAVLAAVMAAEHLGAPVRAGARSRGLKHAAPRARADPATSAPPEPQPRAAVTPAGVTGRTTAHPGPAAEFGGIVRTPDGSPLPSGAITVVTTEGRQVAHTGLDTAGRYRAAVPAPGSYTVIVTAAEYQPAVAVVTV